MTDHLTIPYSKALAAMKIGGPSNLERRVNFEAEELEEKLSVDFNALATHLNGASLNDSLKMEIHRSMAAWDAAKEDEEWTEGIPARTSERRRHIYNRLKLPESAIGLFDDLFPFDDESTVVISEKFDPWYTSSTKQKRGTLYYDAYASYLVEKKNWPAESLASLDEATTDVVARIADPQQERPYQSKGLVVGYVQSGKTANFTGVIAKAIDSGYRLIIVLTGTIDVLRRQTQRRIDMELVGKENILRGVDPHNQTLRNEIDYHDDPDWEEKFIEFGYLPSDMNRPDIIRLTTAKGDYKSLQSGIVALEFEKRDRAKPLYHSENLPFSSARVAIVKKNKTVLNKLLHDIERVRTSTADIPTLIIDDESDQASINTKDPKKVKEGEANRTAINAAISGLLKKMPRAQYIGYTATPFANVFVNPSDAEDIFPKDFLISLKRPPGYMGVSDFHDLDKLEDSERTFENSNEKAIVRDATDNTGSSELAKCVDSFVLTGAIKLLRQDRKEAKFRHHTMLVHESVKTAHHAETAEELRQIWRDAAYHSPAGLNRLQRLFNTDFLPVSRARANGFSVPESFDQLRPFIGSALQKITLFNDPVIVVNGDKAVANEEVDFDKREVWRILVGGTKLSRGFTVEGLTISYYRRKTKQADTLMQMGRWFGFRQGFRDLVRLYVGREEPDGSKTVDLYEAFEAIVKDEEAFRQELRKYSQLVDGKPQITPKEIPPLVFQHLPWLRPAAKNKMFNAELVVRKSPGTLVIPVGYPKIPNHTEHNYRAVEPLLAAAKEQVALRVPKLKNSGETKFDAFIGYASSEMVIEAIENVKWMTDDYFKPDIASLRMACEDTTRWLVIAPQTHEHSKKKNLPGIGLRTVVDRNLREDRTAVWGEPTDRKHRPAAQFVAGAYEDYGDDVLASRKDDVMGALLIYPMAPNSAALSHNPSKDQIVLAVAWVTPEGKTFGDPRLVQFRVKNINMRDAAIVST